LKDTIELLDKHNIKYAGAGTNLSEARKPAYLEKNGLKIALLAYTEMADIVYKGNPPISFAADENKAGVSSLRYEYIKEDIEKIRKEVDFLIVSLHWGTEYVYEVSPSEVDLAHMVIDLGADMIIGHHPHRMKGIEIYKGKPIAYSLGNFISDQGDLRNQEGFILDMEYSGNRLKSLFAVPFVIHKAKAEIVPVKGEAAHYLLETEMRLSKELGSNCKIENDKLVFVIN